VNRTDQPYVLVHDVANWATQLNEQLWRATKGNGQHANGSEPRCAAAGLRASMCAG
jgi:hypothetical protein